MKRFFLLLLVLIPLIFTVEAETFALKLVWDPYPWPTALIRAECKLDAGPYIEVGTVSAAMLELPISTVAAPGQVITCHIRGELSGEVSAWGTEATYRFPLGLTPPTGTAILRAP